MLYIKFRKEVEFYPFNSSDGVPFARNATASTAIYHGTSHDAQMIKTKRLRSVITS